MLLLGCVPALEDECERGADCDGAGQVCIGGVCVARDPGGDAGVADSSTPADVGAPGDVSLDDDGSAPDDGVGPLECAPGFGDADGELGNGCEHGCVVPGPRGDLISETDAPRSGLDLSIAADPETGRALIAWAGEAGGLHIWSDGAVRALGPEGARFDRPDAFRFGSGWVVAARPVGLIGEPRIVGFRITEEGSFSVQILAVDPDPPAVARLGRPTGETAPAAFFLDEKRIRDTGERGLKLAAIVSPGAGGVPIRARDVHDFPNAVRGRVAAASTDLGVVVVFPEHGDEGDLVRVVRVEPGGAFVDSATVEVDWPVEQVSAVNTPEGVLFGAIGARRFYVGRVRYGDGPEPYDFFEVDVGDQEVTDLQMLSLPQGDAAMVVVDEDYAAMILLDATGDVAWADPLVGAGTRVTGAAAVSAGDAAMVSWIRDEDGARKLLWSRVDCR